jgi:hypothetical protein
MKGHSRLIRAASSERRFTSQAARDERQRRLVRRDPVVVEDDAENVLEVQNDGLPG